MASPSFQPRNGELLDVETVARLLRNGSLHGTDKPGIAQAAKHLVSLGLIKTVAGEYVRCVDHRDADYRYVRNRSCRGRIRVDDDLDDGDRLYCPECGRVVYPRRKRRHKMVQVEVQPDGVAAFLQDLLEQNDLEPKQVAPWVWRVDTPRGEAKLVVADYCGLEHVSRDWAAANRACYVVVDSASCKQRFLPEKWLTWTRLAEVVCEPGKLTDLLSSAASTVPATQIRASVPVYSATVRPVVLTDRPGETAVAAGASNKPKKAWPDPQTHTVAKCWTTKDGTFCMSTKTQGRYDGKVKFPLLNGKPTKQMQLMKVLCFEHPNAVPLAKLIDQVYPDSAAKVRTDGAALANLLKTLRTLVSDIRNKKLAPAGINPDILPPLDVEVTANTTLGLRLAHVHDMDAAGCDDSADDRRPGTIPANRLRRRSLS